MIQPYTQYGLNDHSASENFTLKQQSFAQHAIWQLFNDAGIAINESYCGANEYGIGCQIGALNCNIDTLGWLQCGDARQYHECTLEVLGGGSCY